jgi:hypothetical protein
MSKGLSLVVTLLALIAFAGLASAQVPPCTTLPAGTDSEFCVTDNGNTVIMKMLGHQQLSSLIPGEGYGICDHFSGIEYYDYSDGGGVSTNWKPAVLLSSTPLVIGRKTDDGIWELRQTFTTSADGSIKVKMDLNNQTGVNRKATLVRYANVSVDGTASDAFVATSLSAVASDTADPVVSPGIQLLNASKLAGIPLVQKVTSGPHPCTPEADNAGPFALTDGSLELYFDQFTVRRNGVKSATLVYRPF